ncbi:MAG TPA: helix-turn-helix domain-containing protein [Pyrinomonadaceae bacterium]|nr:helix-turn-helix domain-containing protein [Pyrinomonadaceae bacterium]
MSRQTEEAGRTAPAAGASPAGRMAAEERRQQIVSVAMRLFSERGFRGTTTKEIARDAGVSEAIIFRHFATKEDLYHAIIDCKACRGGMADMQNPVAESVRVEVEDAMRRGDDRAVLSGIALSMMRHHHSDPDFLRLLLYSALEGHQLAQMFWDLNVRVLYEFLGSYIRERQRAGALREVDPTVVVRAFTGMVIHHSITSILWDTKRPLLVVSNEDAAREFTEIVLRGIEVGAGEREAAPKGRKGARPSTRRARKSNGQGRAGVKKS